MLSKLNGNQVTCPGNAATSEVKRIKQQKGYSCACMGHSHVGAEFAPVAEMTEGRECQAMGPSCMLHAACWHPAVMKPKASKGTFALRRVFNALCLLYYSFGRPISA